jgi:tRNA U34 2-thiouridine synthase MnmA/TrmU
VAARVTPLSGNRAQVELATAEDAIAPGQACVFYSASDSAGHGRVLGGGWIRQVDHAPLSATRAGVAADISPHQG